MIKRTKDTGSFMMLNILNQVIQDIIFVVEITLMFILLTNIWLQ